MNDSKQPIITAILARGKWYEVDLDCITNIELILKDPYSMCEVSYKDGTIDHVFDIDLVRYKKKGDEAEESLTAEEAIEEIKEILSDSSSNETDKIWSIINRYNRRNNP